RLGSAVVSEGRGIHRDDPRHAVRLQQLRQGQTELGEVLRQRRIGLTEASVAEQNALAQFAAHSDPRTAVGHLSDECPILMLPVRLETRFKTIDVRGGQRHQLWVRVYPDTCSIDTFEATPTANEIDN